MINRFVKAAANALVVGVLGMAGAAHAQADDRASPPSTRSAQVAQAVTDGADAPLPGGSFSAYCIYSYTGMHRLLTCLDWRINSNSRVFASLSEYNYTGPNVGRFMGSARMTTHNVVPFNGGVTIWTDVEWGSPLNVRLDLLVDP